MANVLSLVSYKIFPAKLGGQKGIALFNEYFFKARNLICVTVKSNDPGYAKYPVLNILTDSPLRYINLFYFFTLKKIIKKYKITHLIIEHPYYGWLAVLLKWFCKIKLVVHSHNIESLRFKTVGKWWWRILWAYECFVYKKANLIFCINEEDRQFIISKFGVAPAKCIVITYGIDWDVPPSEAERVAAKKTLGDKYNLPAGTVLYLFNGTLNYLPNLNAVKDIINHINPFLFASGMNYKIIICGKNLPEEMNELKDYQARNILYAGFVDDISIYFKGVDVFINPVNDGGGIKTKLVEALGYDLNAVSTVNGAIGVDAELCDNKLFLTPDSDWQSFAEKMKEAAKQTSQIPPKYFQHFYWQNITAKAVKAIDEI